MLHLLMLVMKGCISALSRSGCTVQNTAQILYLTAIQKQGKVPPVHKFKPEPDIDKDGKITDVLTTGQTVIVQITKEPISTKGPRLASEISHSRKKPGADALF